MATVKVFEFDTTPEEEAQIAKNIDNLGSPGVPTCAYNVYDAIHNVGPFKKLRRRYLPGSLVDQLQKLHAQCLANVAHANDPAYNPGAAAANQLFTLKWLLKTTELDPALNTNRCAGINCIDNKQDF